MHEGVAIGDEVTIGAESVILPGVRIYPFKEVETGSQLHESLIWESRGTTRVFGKHGVAGMVNVDLTPDVAVRLAAALGTALKRGARVVASREGAAACRMIKRAMISGISSTGVHVADLRVSPAAVARHLVKSEAHDAGFHVGVSPNDPEVIRIQFFEPPGVEMSAAMQKEVEKHFTRGELRRVAAGEVGSISYPARVRETYAAELLSTIDAEAVRDRRFRIVVDYGFSGASYVLPLVLGPLGVEVVAAHAFTGEGPDYADAAPGLAASIGQTKRLVPAVGADLGAVFDRSAERLHLVDEQAHEVPVEQALLLFLRLLGSNGRRGKLAFPVTVTSQVEKLVEDSQLEVVRTPASLPELTRAAAEGDVIFAGAVGGGYVFPEFLPGLRRGREPRQAARAARARQPAAVGARRRAAGADARPPPGAVPVGAEGTRDARAERAARGPRARPHRRDQAVRRARLGAGAAGSRRAAPPPLRRGRDARAVGGARARAAGARGRDRAGRGRRGPHLAALCSGRGQRLKFSFTLDRKGLMESLPDLATLSDEDLKKLIDELTREEQEVSYRRRLLHGKIDILRAELVARLQETQGRSVLDSVDVDSLTDILTGKAAPPA